MPKADRMLGMYLHLVRASDLRRQPLVRDKLLVLAGVLASEQGLVQIAALCRQKILAHNSHHLLRRWPTFAAALQDERFALYLKQLRRRYSPEKAEHMLDSLGIQLGRERDAYFSDHEYAAALLGETPESIAVILQPGSSVAAGGVKSGSVEPADFSKADRKPSEKIESKAPQLATASEPMGDRRRTFGFGHPTARVLAADWGPFVLGMLVLLVLVVWQLL